MIARRPRLLARPPRAPKPVKYKTSGAPLIKIDNATFYRSHPSSIPPPTADSSASNPALFPNFTFSHPSSATPNQHWAILGRSSLVNTTLLQVLRGQHICITPRARQYPHLSSYEITQKDPKLRYPGRAIQYVGFDADRSGSGAATIHGAYLSARYESRREETDFSLQDYLTGHTELNASEELAEHPTDDLLDRIVHDLDLQDLLSMPLTNLSNGQTRRARIAKALLSNPEMLLLDGAFMGLDPRAQRSLSRNLHQLAQADSPRIVLALKPRDRIPNWITHMVYLDDDYSVLKVGPVEHVYNFIRQRVLDILFKKSPAEIRADLSWMGAFEDGRNLVNQTGEGVEIGRRRIVSSERYRKSAGIWIGDERASRPYGLYQPTAVIDEQLHLPELPPASEIDAEDLSVLWGQQEYSEDGTGFFDDPTPAPGDVVIELEGVQIAYGGKPVLGDWQQDIDGSPKEGFWWTVRQGQRWGVFGPNGSGKTTLLSLLTSEHPQSYSAPLKLFGRSRLPTLGQPGISIFDIQSRIGHSSPEVHAFFPKHISVRQVIESAWADAPLAKMHLTHEMDNKVDAALRWFQGELNPKLGPVKWMKEFTTRLDSYHNLEGRPPSRTIQKAVKDMEQKDWSLNTDVQWADNVRFGEMSFSAQRVALFIRAIIAQRDLIILDEAFSGMEDDARIKCMTFLTWGEDRALQRLSTTAHADEEGNTNPEFGRGRPRLRLAKVAKSDIAWANQVRIEGLQKHQALIVVSHRKEEVPGCVREWICLPEPGSREPPRSGQLKAPLSWLRAGWSEIWGMREDEWVEGTSDSFLPMALTRNRPQALPPDHIDWAPPIGTPGLLSWAPSFENHRAQIIRNKTITLFNQNGRIVMQIRCIIAAAKARQAGVPECFAEAIKAGFHHPYPWLYSEVVRLKRKTTAIGNKLLKIYNHAAPLPSSLKRKKLLKSESKLRVPKHISRRVAEDGYDDPLPWMAMKVRKRGERLAHIVWTVLDRFPHLADHFPSRRRRWTSNRQGGLVELKSTDREYLTRRAAEAGFADPLAFIQHLVLYSNTQIHHFSTRLRHVLERRSKLPRVPNRSKKGRPSPRPNKKTVGLGKMMLALKTPPRLTNE